LIATAQADRNRSPRSDASSVRRNVAASVPLAATADVAASASVDGDVEPAPASVLASLSEADAAAEPVAVAPLPALATKRASFCRLDLAV
jgi:hypothetical protein